MTLVNPKRKPTGFTREMREARQGLGPNRDQIFLAQHAPATEKTKEIHVDAETSRPDTNLSPVELEHTRAGRVRMWALTSVGSVPRWISNNGNHLQIAMQCGLSPVCHDCGGEHDGGRNDCPGRDPVQYRLCPVCRKPFFDPHPTGMVAQKDALQVIGIDPDGNPIMGTAEQDELLIGNEDLGSSTPATRTQAMVRQHMGAFHKADFLIYFPNERFETPAVI